MKIFNFDILVTDNNKDELKIIIKRDEAIFHDNMNLKGKPQ